MKKITGILAVMLLVCSLFSGCQSKPEVAPTCDELIAAYKAAGYHTFHVEEDGEMDWNCYVKVWDEDEYDYVYFHFFDSPEAAQAYDAEREYNVLIYLFSVIYGDPSWLYTETYGNIEYEYCSKKLMEPFEELIS